MKNSTKGAIVFLLDSNFLPGLKAFVNSAENAFNNASEDVLIISDDPELLEDPFVDDLADRKVLITDEQINNFKKINHTAVSEKYNNRDFGAYWFLKFCAFRDYGYSYHIFVDTDLICFDENFRFSDIPSGADICAARSVGPKTLRMKSWEHRPFFWRLKTQLSLKRVTTKNYTINSPINSGVMRIGNRFLGEKTFTGLIELATKEAFSLEQKVVIEYIRREGGSFKLLPFWYNFTILCAQGLGQKGFQKISSQVKILHFNRSQKPWESTEGDKDWLDAIWASYEVP